MKEIEDCYYFLYSECKRGSTCGYRHNPYTKLNPVICKKWEETGECREDCPFRHSRYHLDKKRSEDYCYWEEKGGCKKEFCEFKHRDEERDEWKKGGIKSLRQIRKEKMKRGEEKEEEFDFDAFERERREKLQQKRKRSEERGEKRQISSAKAIDSNRDNEYDSNRDNEYDSNRDNDIDNNNRDDRYNEYDINGDDNDRDNDIDNRDNRDNNDRDNDKKLLEESELDKELNELDDILNN